MIEKLPQGTFRESDIVAKLNELIEAHNNHIHQYWNRDGTTSHHDKTGLPMDRSE